MNPLSHTPWLVVSAALAGCSGQVLDVGSTGQALTQGDGGQSDPQTIANLASAPLRMASDGTSLYWTEQTSEALTGMPVQGGPKTTVAASCSLLFLAVDSTSVYFVRDFQLYAAPKNAAGALSISDGSGSVTAAAVHGTNAFWAETPNQEPRVVAVKSASLTDKVASIVGQLFATPAPPLQMTATTGLVFLADPRPLTAFSLGSGAPDGGPPQTLGSSFCGILLSDDGAAYCVPPGGPVTRTGDDGNTTTLTTVSSGTAAALDATYLYFGDKPASGGLLLKIPKLGGTATVIAHEEATALAVDDTAIYWATPKGYIRRLLK